MKQLRLIGLVLLHPAAGFRALLERPKAAVAVLLLIGACIAAHATIHARIDVAAQQRLTAAELTSGKPGSDVSDEELVETAQQALNLRRLGGYGAYLVLIPVSLAIMAFLFWLMFAGWKLEAGYRSGFRLMAHASLPLAVRQLISLPVLMSYPSIDPANTHGLFKTSLANILAGTEVPFGALFDPFVLWAGVLVGLAGHALGRHWAWCLGVSLVFWNLFASLSSRVF